MLCFSAIFSRTGFCSKTGSLDLSPNGRSGDPKGEYAVNRMPATRQKICQYCLPNADYVTTPRGVFSEVGHFHARMHSF